MSTVTEEPIAYQLLMHRAIIAFITLKTALPAKHASIDTLIDCYRALRQWSETGQPPVINAVTPHPAAQIAINSIIEMRRSRAAKLDATDPDDDGLEWLDDLCHHLHSVIADPGQELDAP